jgi:hypothetical protein
VNRAFRDPAAIFVVKLGRYHEDTKLDAQAGEACIVRQAEERDFRQSQAASVARKRAGNSIGPQPQTSPRRFFGVLN